MPYNTTVEGTPGRRQGGVLIVPLKKAFELYVIIPKEYLYTSSNPEGIMEDEAFHLMVNGVPGIECDQGIEFFSGDAPARDVASDGSLHLKFTSGHKGFEIEDDYELTVCRGSAFGEVIATYQVRAVDPHAEVMALQQGLQQAQAAVRDAQARQRERENHLEFLRDQEDEAFHAREEALLRAELLEDRLKELEATTEAARRNRSIDEEHLEAMVAEARQEHAEAEAVAAARDVQADGLAANRLQVDLALQEAELDLEVAERMQSLFAAGELSRMDELALMKQARQEVLDEHKQHADARLKDVEAKKEALREHEERLRSAKIEVVKAKASEKAARFKIWWHEEVRSWWIPFTQEGIFPYVATIAGLIGLGAILWILNTIGDWLIPVVLTVLLGAGCVWLLLRKVKVLHVASLFGLGFVLSFAGWGVLKKYTDVEISLVPKEEPMLMTYSAKRFDLLKREDGVFVSARPMAHLPRYQLEQAPKAEVIPEPKPVPEPPKQESKPKVETPKADTPDAGPTPEKAPEEAPAEAKPEPEKKPEPKKTKDKKKLKRGHDVGLYHYVVDSFRSEPEIDMSSFERSLYKWGSLFFLAIFLFCTWAFWPMVKFFLKILIFPWGMYSVWSWWKRRGEPEGDDDPDTEYDEDGGGEATHAPPADI